MRMMIVLSNKIIINHFFVSQWIMGFHIVQIKHAIFRLHAQRYYGTSGNDQLKFSPAKYKNKNKTGKA